jgi:hypothetical protein
VAISRTRSRGQSPERLASRFAEPDAARIGLIVHEHAVEAEQHQPVLLAVRFDERSNLFDVVHSADHYPICRRRARVHGPRLAGAIAYATCKYFERKLMPIVPQRNGTDMRR